MGNYKNYSNISNSIIGDNNQVNIQTNEVIKKHSYTIEKDILVGITCSALYEFIKWCLGIYM